MTEVINPEYIPVEAPTSLHADSTYHEPMVTGLFKPDVHLSEVFALTHEISDKPQDLNILSGACSVGAEIDGIAALQKLYGYPGRLALFGCDANSLAVSVAERGRHIITKRLTKIPRFQQQLEGLGFSTARELDDNYGFEAVPQEYLVAYSGNLRAPHQVEFATKDLTRPWAEDRQYDLILLNNVLFFYGIKNMIKILANLCLHLSDKGVLSLGEYSLEDDWRRRPVEKFLSDRFDLVARTDITGEFKQSVAYTRA
jgi:chemotaxis methyl-accepting protein methylase